MSPGSESGFAEVFICHSSLDEVRAIAIGEALETHGVNAWWAEKGIPGGVNWKVRVSPAIRNCKAVVLLCTNSALASGPVLGEVTLAEQCDKPLIPLFIDRIVERIVDLKPPWDLTLGSPTAIWVLDRPTDQWLPLLLDSLNRFGVTTRPSSTGSAVTSRPGTSPGKLPSFARPQFSETELWLQEFRMVGDRLRAWATDARDSNDLASAFRRRTSDAVDVLTAINDDLPDLQGTLVAMARNDEIPTEELAALCQLQGALVDIARAVMHLKREKGEGLDDLALPPYDLWLPFKGGPTTPSAKNTA